MIKITFIGAGSTVFAKNVLGNVMLTPTISTSSEFCSAKPTFPSRGRLSNNLFVLCYNVT